jgi:hypothetical protein
MTLDYKRPPPPPRTGQTAVLFWTAFCVAALIGSVPALLLDDGMYHWMTSRSGADGGVTFISIGAVPIAAVVVAVVRRSFGGHKVRWIWASIFGLVAMPVGVVTLYTFF